MCSSEMLENQICVPASAENCWRPSDLGDSFYTYLFVGLLTRACIVWAAYVFLGKSWKIKSVVQRRLEFMQAVRFGRYVLNGLAWCTSCAVLHFLVAYSFSGKSLKTESVIQRRLDFLKAVRCGRYLLNEIVWWVAGEGLHRLIHIWISSEILENKICDPESAGISENRRIGDLRFQQTCSLDFLRGPA